MIPAAIILLVLFILNGLFAMSELAMMTSRPSRLQQSAAHGHRGAAIAMMLAREPTRFLSTVQVAITLIGILTGAFGASHFSEPLQTVLARWPALAPYSDEIALAAVVLAMTYFSLVLGELVPKRLALAHPEAIAAWIARPLNAMAVVTAPAVKVLTVSTDAILKGMRVKHRASEDVSEEDIKALVHRAAGMGVFDPTEHNLFKRVFRVSDLRVKSLMVPRTDVVWVDERMTVDDIRVLVGTSPFSHFPVCRGGLDELLGVVHIKDLIAHGLVAGKNFKVVDAARPPLIVPESMPALKLLDGFKKAKIHIAFVVDEYGGTEGLVTLNDVVQALVGDIHREGEEEPPQAVRRADGSWLIDARLPMHELGILLGLSEDAMKEIPEVHTAAGLVMALLGRVPQTGEIAAWHGWRLEVVDMDGNRVDKILAEKVAPVAPPPS